jgi:predicted NACHT family NTPase
MARIITKAQANANGSERKVYELTVQMKTDEAQVIFDGLDPESQARARQVIKDLGPSIARVSRH